MTRVLSVLALCAITLAPARAEFPRGKTAPPFTLKQPDGKSLSLRALRGRVVFLDFWGPS